MLIGGSPCQWFSLAGKMLNFDDPRSKLFFEFVRLLKECKPKYFLLENVKMKQQWQDIISSALGVHPIEINSSLVSAQNRRRLYRTNIPHVSQPQDKWIILKDILEDNVDEKYNYSQDRWQMLLANKYAIEERLEWFMGDTASLTWRKNECDDGKWALDAHNIDWSGKLLIKQAVKWSYIIVEEWDWISLAYPQSTTRRGRVIKWKSATLTANGDEWVYDKVIRKLTPIEYERLQTLPDNYTAWVSDSQRYKMLGNGRTVDVIAHIFSFMECKSPLKDAER